MQLDSGIIFIFLWVLLIGVVSAAPVVLIVALILRHRKRDREAAEKLYQLKAKELENESVKINENKIVSCPYCGKQSRYKEKICRYCGAALEYENGSGER